MSNGNAVAAAVRPPLNPTPPPADCEKPRPGSQDPALKKKKKLLNGANIKFTFPSGAMYEGSFKDGKIEGYGVYTYAQTGDVYAGEWKADLKHGHGSYKFANGDRYVGQWYMGNKHGKGQFAFTNGDEYVGSWRDNQMNGYGVFHIVESGDRYEGYWKGGLRQGRGTLRHGNGDVYDGEWDSGQQQGLGVFYQSNNDLYCGEWKDGSMDGKGVQREKGITFLVEYVGGYLISKLKLTEATDELEQGWAVVYNYFLKWLEERETVKIPELSPAAVDKMKDELDAAHAENSILRKRLEAAMQLLQSKSRDGEGQSDASSAANGASKEAVVAAYWHESLQKSEAKVKLLECTLAERVVEIRKLTELVSSSDAKIKEYEIGKAARKAKGLANKLANSYTGVNVEEASLDATRAPAEEEEEGDNVEVEELKVQNAVLLQLNDELQRKNAFLSLETAKLALKREAAEEQYEKLAEQLSELRAKMAPSDLQTEALLQPEVMEKLSQLQAYDETSSTTLSMTSTGSLGTDELQKRLVQANQLNIELRLKNGELQRKMGNKQDKESSGLTEAAAQGLSEENEALRSTIERLKKQVKALEGTSDDVEKRLYAATQREADLQAAVISMSKEKSADPRLQQALEGKSDQIAKLQLENAELARLLEEAQSRPAQKDAATPREKRQNSTSSSHRDDEQAEVAALHKEVKKLQKRVRKVTAERDAVAEQFYDSQVHLARTHRVLGAMQGQLIVFASLSDVDTGNGSKVDSVVRIDETDPSRMMLSDCGEEVAYKLDYCFGKEASAPQIFSEVRDALSFVWSGFQFALVTIGELRSGKSTLVTQLFPLLVQNLLRATEEDPHAAYFSYTYRVAVVEVSARGGYDCASEKTIEEVCRDSNGYVHPKGVRFIDCTSVSISTIVDNLLGKRRQHYNGRAHTWIQLQCVRTGLAQQSQTVGRLTVFDWCGPGPLSSQKTDIESARFANASSQALRDVASSLSLGSGVVPYTKSLVTALLFDLLGGNSITAVVGRIRPSPEHVEESIRTLGVLSALFGARNGPLLQDSQTCDEIRWRGLVGALSSDDQAERGLKTVENGREF